MYSLPILADEIAIPLDRYEVEGEDPKGPRIVICEYPGVTAYARPFDVEAASRWNDAVSSLPNSRSLQATVVVMNHITRIEGLMMSDPATGAAVPYQANLQAHRRSLPMPMRDAIYLALRKRAELPAVTEKNSGLPSGSDGTASSGSSPAVDVASAPATT